jgi:hypothetical protein
MNAGTHKPSEYRFIHERQAWFKRWIQFQNSKFRVEAFPQESEDENSGISVLK